jgi:antitoxin CcdA
LDVAVTAWSSREQAARLAIIMGMRIQCASYLFEEFIMRTNAIGPATAQKKRAVNLTLSEGLVAEAKTFTGNLSATMEALLADYVAQQQQARLSRQQAANACVEYWNEVHAAEGSFADEHSTL